MAIGPVFNPLTALPGITNPATTGRVAGDGGSGFDNIFGKLLTDANQDSLQADQAVKDLITGKTNSLHDVVLAAAKADLSMQLVVEIRNKLVETYQEIMRMQV